MGLEWEPGIGEAKAKGNCCVTLDRQDRDLYSDLIGCNELFRSDQVSSKRLHKKFTKES